MTTTRSGKSLIEVLLVVAILAVLIGLVLGAVQKVRGEAARLQSVYNLRQINQTLHIYLAQNEEKVKKLPRNESVRVIPNRPMIFDADSIFSKLSPLLVTPAPMPTHAGEYTPEEVQAIFYPKISLYISPADPSINYPIRYTNVGKISYAANMSAFNNVLTFPISIPDGTSSTISFGETYWHSELQVTEVGAAPGVTITLSCELDWVTHVGPDTNGNSTPRRATFADRGTDDVHPVPDGQGNSVGTRSAYFTLPAAKKPFMYRPPVTRCFCDRLLTPHVAGLPVAMFDGSVRTLNPNTDEKVFWGLVTPAGGEVLGDY